MTLIYKGVPWSECLVRQRWRCKLCSRRIERDERAYRPMEIQNGVQRNARICVGCVDKIGKGQK